MTSRTDELRPTVFGTGLIALDLVISADPVMPVRSWVGGTCGNVLSILAFLGWSAYPIARLNGDSASRRVKTDLSKWGVRLDFAACSPTTDTPIIVQEIRRNQDGLPTHRFSWSCPRCGGWLPRFKPVTTTSTKPVLSKLRVASVFFMDRLSRAALTMAAQASADGALVVFEPSGRSNAKLLTEALNVAHVVKYAHRRRGELAEAMEAGSATLLEVHTLGPRGLHFRHKLGRRASGWEYLPAIAAPRLVDTCGAGDWCTAGLIAKIGHGGSQGFAAAGVEAVRRALRYGQALAAWNCGFEGARGGMYAVEREAFDCQIKALLSGGPEVRPADPPQRRRNSTTIACPACPKGQVRPAVRAVVKQNGVAKEGRSSVK